MDRSTKLNMISSVMCDVHNISECPFRNVTSCIKYGSCRLMEKTDEQLNYILSPINECIYLEACAGSGKTEVLGMKAAYELCKWSSSNTGIAVLTFTNEATSTIADRISHFYHKTISANHFIGTFSSFVHGHIAQRFGYKIYGNNSVKDKSFLVIDSDMSHYSNQWLENYAVHFPILKHEKIYANQLYYRVSSKEWFVVKEDQPTSIRALFEREETQNYINEIREKSGKPHLFEYDYLCKMVKECKKKFWESGFATFEDMNLIARKCLLDKEIVSRLARKFPLIMVDECQDLSKNELEILSLFIKAGSTVHYIGDLHQAIYSFKDSLPEYFHDHSDKHHFKVMQLSDNFRSTQNIVDVSCILGGINKPLVGTVKSRFDGQDCYYFEYGEEKDALAAFEAIIRSKEIQAQDSIILVRSQATKTRLNEMPSRDFRKHAILNAVQLWNQGSPNYKILALQLVGWQIQQWLGSQGRANSFYYCSKICPNAATWRFMLRDILNDFCRDKSICSFDGILYSQWYKMNKKRIEEIVNCHTIPTIGHAFDHIGKSLKAPRGSASLPIEIIACENKKNIRVETIHSVKGAAFDAVLLLSTPDAHGKTGYWESWLNPSDEAARISYVACTRPRYLLCWGVHKLSDAQRDIIERMGFIKYECTDKPQQAEE